MGAGYDAVVTRKRNCGDESDDVTKVRDRVIGWHILKNTIKNVNLQKKSLLVQTGGGKSVR